MWSIKRDEGEECRDISSMLTLEMTVAVSGPHFAPCPESSCDSNLAERGDGPGILTVPDRRYIDSGAVDCTRKEDAKSATSVVVTLPMH